MAELLIDMPSGVAGDMLLGALLDLGGDCAQVERDLLRLGIGPIHIRVERVSVSGITANQVDVQAEQEPTWRQPAQEKGPLRIIGPASLSPLSAQGKPIHPHRPYRIIRELIAAADLPTRVRERAQKVFRILAEAEGRVHGVATDDVEFHEVGSLDAIADVVGTCLLLEQLHIDRIIAGPLLPGEGSVRCAHGMMPVPVPAVAAMLAEHRAPQRRSARETGELTTPTGCALVIGLADAWLNEEQTIHADAVGYGAGHKRFPDRANVLRVHRLRTTGAETDQVGELRATMDDATGEDLAAAIATLLSAGARDAWLVPVVMKKGRPGFELVVLTAPADRERLGDILLQSTPSIGLRWRLCERRILPRHMVSVTVDGHVIPCKVVALPGGGQRAKPEDDAVLAAAAILGRPPADIRAAAVAAWRNHPQ